MEEGEVVPASISEAVPQLQLLVYNGGPPQNGVCSRDGQRSVATHDQVAGCGPPLWLLSVPLVCILLLIPIVPKSYSMMISMAAAISWPPPDSEKVQPASEGTRSSIKGPLMAYGVGVFEELERLCVRVGHREVDGACLAHDGRDRDRLAPGRLCVVGTENNTHPSGWGLLLNSDVYVL